MYRPGSAIGHHAVYQKMGTVISFGDEAFKTGGKEDQGLIQASGHRRDKRLLGYTSVLARRKRRCLMGSKRATS